MSGAKYFKCFPTAKSFHGGKWVVNSIYILLANQAYKVFHCKETTKQKWLVHVHFSLNCFWLSNMYCTQIHKAVILQLCETFGQKYAGVERSDVARQTQKNPFSNYKKIHLKALNSLNNEKQSKWGGSLEPNLCDFILNVFSVGNNIAYEHLPSEQRSILCSNHWVQAAMKTVTSVSSASSYSITKVKERCFQYIWYDYKDLFTS